MSRAEDLGGASEMICLKGRAGLCTYLLPALSGRGPVDGCRQLRRGRGDLRRRSIPGSVQRRLRGRGAA